MPENKGRFAVVKARCSKGETLHEEIVGVFETGSDAYSYLEDYLKSADHGFRRSDWDEYGV
jgi:predicted RNA-binding protein